MLDNYTLIQWLAFFLIYCFFGWCIESTIVSFTKKRLVNRGFLRGPILPLYGFGAIVMLVSTLWIKDNIVLVYLFGAIAATCLEYVTGASMEALLKIKYWDYSDKMFNLNGYICLKSSLFWGILTLVLLKIIHKPIATIITNIDLSKLTIAIYILFCIAVIDCIDSFRRAFDLQKLLNYETRIRNEISEITVKLAAIKSNLTGSLSEDHVVREESLQEEGVRNLEVYIDKLKGELELVMEKAGSLKTMLISFPSATSKKFNDALQDLKAHFYK